LVLAVAALSAEVALIVAAGTDDVSNIPVTLKDHQFTPSEIHVPQGKPVVLTITNADPTAEEFDSSALKIDQLIGAGEDR
jgi:hypothetical protein